MPEPIAFSTQAAHAGRDKPTPSLSRPLTAAIHQSTVYAFDRLDDLDTLNPDAHSYSYYRYGTPTHAALERGIAALEGAGGAVAASSGMAIITAALLALAGAGDRVVADQHAYGGTYTLVMEELPRLGITATLVDATNIAEVERALEGGPKDLDRGALEPDFTGQRYTGPLSGGAGTRRAGARRRHVRLASPYPPARARRGALLAFRR